MKSKLLSTFKYLLAVVAHDISVLRVVQVKRIFVRPQMILKIKGVSEGPVLATRKIAEEKWLTRLLLI